ncbi:hypothetical protein ACEXOS_015190 [Herbiconiux sp. P16]|uniref:hypothetical protein n=1 Tax=Herbiconiux wuyangfengii TaxID=3342794 RepID=UPI0035BA5F1B
MGKASRTKLDRFNATSGTPEETHEPETHEPKKPQSWPAGHANVALTGADQGECIIVTVHGVRHYLHSTTARALSDKLLSRIDEWNGVAREAGVPEV